MGRSESWPAPPVASQACGSLALKATPVAAET